MLGDTRDAFAFGAAGQMNPAAAIAAIRPQFVAETGGGGERFSVRRIGCLLQADTQSRTHRVTILHLPG
jgi:hypothetical protein